RVLDTKARADQLCQTRQRPEVAIQARRAGGAAHEPGEFGPVLGRELEGPGAGAQDDLAVVLLGALLPTVEGLPRDAVAPGDFGDGLSRSQFRQGSLPMGGLLGAITKVVVGIGLFGSHPQASRTRARTVSSYGVRVSSSTFAPSPSPFGPVSNILDAKLGVPPPCQAG